MAIQSELLAAINQIAHERKIDADSVIEALKVALVNAFKRDYYNENLPTDLKAEIGVESGIIKIIAIREVVADKDVIDTKIQISLTDAKSITKTLKIGDKVETELPIAAGFGRIAAQTAKQVLLQKIREAEKESIISEYQDKIGTLVSGSVQRVVQGNIIAEIGKATGLMPVEEKIFQEYYKTGETYKFLLKDVIKKQTEGNYPAQLLLSRSDPSFLKELFAVEVPEIQSEIVEVKSIAREAGSRSKVAVSSNQEGIDPIGSCVGQKGIRILNIQEELSDNNYEEKIDIIEWHEDSAQFVANSLSPAKVDDVKLNEELATAYVYVAEDQLSLAIGKEGQNVRLAHKLTGWKIEINPEKEAKVEKITKKKVVKKTAKKVVKKVTVKKVAKKSTTKKKVSKKVVAKKVVAKKIVAKKTSTEKSVSKKVKTVPKKKVTKKTKAPKKAKK